MRTAPEFKGPTNTCGISKLFLTAFLQESMDELYLGEEGVDWLQNRILHDKGGVGFLEK